MVPMANDIAPGFWRADERNPRLPAWLGKNHFCQNAESMVGSQEPWQLIVSFNEAGKGTMIKASESSWSSNAGYGDYLDCLHQFPS
jgi:hypothetical protein